MIDPHHAFASWFLWLGGLLFLLVYGLPLLLAPLGWARIFCWRLPAERDLAVYLGRCLGGVAIAIVVAAFRAAPAPAGHPLVFELIAVSCGLLTLVHVWGALRRTQPWTETVEIALYAAVTAIAVILRLGLSG